jgi:hypothetical protein
VDDGAADVAASIKARLREELARRAELARELAALDAAAPIDVEAVLLDVESRAGDLRGLLRRHPTQARQVVRLLLGEGRWACEPFHNAQGVGYHCTAMGSYARLGVKGLEAFTIGYTAQATE